MRIDLATLGNGSGVLPAASGMIELPDLADVFAAAVVAHRLLSFRVWDIAYLRNDADCKPSSQARVVSGGSAIPWSHLIGSIYYLIKGGFHPQLCGKSELAFLQTVGSPGLDNSQDPRTSGS